MAHPDSQTTDPPAPEAWVVLDYARPGLGLAPGDYVARYGDDDAICIVRTVRPGDDGYSALNALLPARPNLRVIE